LSDATSTIPASDTHSYTVPTETEQAKWIAGGSLSEPSPTTYYPGSTVSLVSTGALAAGFSATIPVPAGIINNDILILITVGYNRSVNAAAAGYAAFIDNPSFTYDTGFAFSTTAWWKRTTGTESTAVVMSGSGATFGQMFAFRGCKTSGTPIDAVSTLTTQFTGATSGNIGLTAVTGGAFPVLIVNNLRGSADPGMPSVSGDVATLQTQITNFDSGDYLNVSLWTGSALPVNTAISDTASSSYSAFYQLFELIPATTAFYTQALQPLEYEISTQRSVANQVEYSTAADAFDAGFSRVATEVEYSSGYDSQSFSVSVIATQAENSLLSDAALVSKASPADQYETQTAADFTFASAGVEFIIEPLFAHDTQVSNVIVSSTCLYNVSALLSIQSGLLANQTSVEYATPSEIIDSRLSHVEIYANTLLSDASPVALVNNTAVLHANVVNQALVDCAFNGGMVFSYSITETAYVSDTVNAGKLFIDNLSLGIVPTVNTITNYAAIVSHSAHTNANYAIVNYTADSSGFALAEAAIPGDINRGLAIISTYTPEALLAADALTYSIVYRSALLFDAAATGTANILQGLDNPLTESIFAHDIILTGDSLDLSIFEDLSALDSIPHRIVMSAAQVDAATPASLDISNELTPNKTHIAVASSDVSIIAGTVVHKTISDSAQQYENISALNSIHYTLNEVLSAIDANQIVSHYVDTLPINIPAASVNFDLTNNVNAININSTVSVDNLIGMRVTRSISEQISPSDVVVEELKIIVNESLNADAIYAVQFIIARGITEALASDDYLYIINSINGLPPQAISGSDALSVSQIFAERPVESINAIDEPLIFHSEGISEQQVFTNTVVESVSSNDAVLSGMTPNRTESDYVQPYEATLPNNASTAFVSDAATASDANATKQSAAAITAEVASMNDYEQIKLIMPSASSDANIVYDSIYAQRTLGYTNAEAISSSDAVSNVFISVDTIKEASFTVDSIPSTVMSYNTVSEVLSASDTHSDSHSEGISDAQSFSEFMHESATASDGIQYKLYCNVPFGSTIVASDFIYTIQAFNNNVNEVALLGDNNQTIMVGVSTLNESCAADLVATVSNSMSDVVTESSATSDQVNSGVSLSISMDNVIDLTCDHGTQAQFVSIVPEACVAVMYGDTTTVAQGASRNIIRTSVSIPLVDISSIDITSSDINLNVSIS
jgi:hypothetical protein